MKRFGLLSLVLALSTPAFADVCITSSAGLYFSSTASDINSSSSQAVSQCQQNLYTNNSDCVRNLSCSYYANLPYPSGRVVCQVSSAGLRFESQGSASEINRVSSEVVNRCRANPYTSNSDCQISLSCRDGQYIDPIPGSGGEAIQCRTESNGLKFYLRGTDTNTVSSGVVQMCRANQFTNNSDCVQNMQCGPAYGSPALRNVACYTQSYGLNFREYGTDINQVSSSVVQHCRANQYTNNSECVSSLRCEYIHSN